MQAFVGAVSEAGTHLAGRGKDAAANKKMPAGWMRRIVSFARGKKKQDAAKYQLTIF